MDPRDADLADVLRQIATCVLQHPGMCVRHDPCSCVALTARRVNAQKAIQPSLRRAIISLERMLD